MNRPAAVLGLIGCAFLLCVSGKAQTVSDVLTIGKAVAEPGERVSVPVYVLDVSGTALDANQAKRIRQLSFIVNFSNPSKINGCFSPNLPNCAVFWRKIGSTLGGTTETFKGSASLGVIIVAADGAPDLTLNKFPPGDHIGDLVVTVDGDSDIGDTLGFTLDSASADNFFADETGTVKEVSGAGLSLVDGAIIVVACSSPPPSFSLTYTCGSGLSSPCPTDTPVTFKLPIGYTLETCDSVLWEFGDNSFVTNSSTSAEHTYKAGGTFTAKATVSNTGGFQTATTDVTVGSVPIVVCQCSSAGPASLVPNQIGTFTVTSTCTPATYLWKFDDGPPLVTSTPVINYKYPVTGTYTWTVTVQTTTAPSCPVSRVIVIEPVKERRRAAKAP